MKLKLNHFNATAKLAGFRDIEHMLTERYITQRMSQDALADELEIGITMLRTMLKHFDIKKPEIPIPLKYEDARRMGPDALAAMLGVSRATAWRWKRKIMALHSDREATEVMRALGVDEA